MRKKFRSAFIKTLPVMAGYLVLRFLPFLIFGKKKTPDFITYLGKVLPYSIMAMLVVYCVKDTGFSSMSEWLPMLCSVAVTVIVQVWKRNSIYSILAGTILYMILIRVI